MTDCQFTTCHTVHFAKCTDCHDNLSVYNIGSLLILLSQNKEWGGGNLGEVGAVLRQPGKNLFAVLRDLVSMLVFSLFSFDLCILKISGLL